MGTIFLVYLIAVGFFNMSPDKPIVILNSILKMIDVEKLAEVFKRSFEVLVNSPAWGELQKTLGLMVQELLK